MIITYQNLEYIITHLWFHVNHKTYSYMCTVQPLCGSWYQNFRIFQINGKTVVNPDDKMCYTAKLYHGSEKKIASGVIDNINEMMFKWWKEYVAFLVDFQAQLSHNNQCCNSKHGIRWRSHPDDLHINVPMWWETTGLRWILFTKGRECRPLILRIR